jgi:hypothetical protein
VTEFQVADVPALWSVHIPDGGVYRPVSSREDAVRQVALLAEDGVVAVVRPWPYDAASHPAGADR